MNWIKKINAVYNMLEDNKSREIFLNRVLWYITDDKEYLRNMVFNSNEAFRKIGCSSSVELSKSFDYFVDKCMKADGNIIVYGLGAYGQNFVRTFPAKERLIICDKKAEDGMNGYQVENITIPVISKKELYSCYNGEYIVITTVNYATEIENDLLTNGIHKEKIMSILDDSNVLISDHNQYFEQEIVSVEEKEIFVDCGFFHGETSKSFAEWCNNNYETIIAFEPSKSNYNYLIQNNILKNIEKLELYNYAAWNEKTNMLLWVEGRSDSCRVSEKGTELIECDTIDNVLNGRKATFIKMDVEGSELNALMGAENTIKKYAPKLAISIYHKPEDIVDIQYYISTIYPKYKFYIRHYTNYCNETVLLCTSHRSCTNSC